MSNEIDYQFEEYYRDEHGSLRRKFPKIVEGRGKRKRNALRISKQRESATTYEVISNTGEDKGSAITESNSV